MPKCAHGHMSFRRLRLTCERRALGQRWFWQRAWINLYYGVFGCFSFSNQQNKATGAGGPDAGREETYINRVHGVVEAWKEAEGLQQRDIGQV